MKAMRVIVTGSRDWTDKAAIFAALDTLALAARTINAKLIVAHGCAAGADSIADQWVRTRRLEGWPVEPERHPANWRKYGRKRAGHIRNAQMVRVGADACLAFINPCSDTKCRKPTPHGSHGATGCADLADGAGIPTPRDERFEGIPTQRIERVSEGSDTRG